MNGVHDMGGMDGFGKVEPEPNEPMFHADWEARVMAMVRAMGAAGAFNIDASRYYRETLPPATYLASSYYKKWFLGLENLLVDKGYVAEADIAAGHAVQPAKALKRGRFAQSDVERIMVRGKFVVRDRKLVGAKNDGAYVSRAKSPYAAPSGRLAHGFQRMPSKPISHACWMGQLKGRRALTSSSASAASFGEAPWVIVRWGTGSVSRPPYGGASGHRPNTSVVSARNG